MVSAEISNIQKKLQNKSHVDEWETTNKINQTTNLKVQDVAKSMV